MRVLPNEQIQDLVRFLHYVDDEQRRIFEDVMSDNREFLRTIAKAHLLRLSAETAKKQRAAVTNEIEIEAEKRRKKLAVQQLEYLAATQRKIDKRRRYRAMQELEQEREEAERVCIDIFFDMIFKVLEDLSRSDDLDFVQDLYDDSVHVTRATLRQTENQFWDLPENGDVNDEIIPGRSDDDDDDPDPEPAQSALRPPEP